MENTPEQKTIKSAVLDKILKGDVTARSKSYFILKNGLLILTIVIISSFILFATSFIMFALQESKMWYLPMFGLKGFKVLLGNFPWILTLLVILFIVVLEILVNRYGFAYRRPLLYSALGIVFIVVAISFLVKQTPLHGAIYNQIERGRLPMARSLYEGYAKPNVKDFHPGTVLELKESGFLIANRDGTLIEVIVTDQTKMKPGFRIELNRRLLIIGKMRDNVVVADAIEDAPNNPPPMEKRPQ